MTNIVGRLRETAMSVRTTERQICDEAADEIERLRDALRDLLDVQNGPPLVRRADEWQAAVDKARAALKEGK